MPIPLKHVPSTRKLELSTHIWVTGPRKYIFLSATHCYNCALCFSNSMILAACDIVHLSKNKMDSHQLSPKILFSKRGWSIIRGK